METKNTSSVIAKIDTLYSNVKAIEKMSTQQFTMEQIKQMKSELFPRDPNIISDDNKSERNKFLAGNVKMHDVERHLRQNSPKVGIREQMVGLKQALTQGAGFLQASRTLSKVQENIIDSKKNNKPKRTL